MTEEEIREGLDRWFGHADFRPGQYAPIEAVVNGRDAVVITPTATPDVRRDIIAQLKLEGRSSAAGQ